MVRIIFAKIGSHYDDFVTILMNNTGIIHIGSLKMVDSPLMFIFMLLQQVYRLSFQLQRGPIVCLWQYRTMDNE